MEGLEADPGRVGHRVLRSNPGIPGIGFSPTIRGEYRKSASISRKEIYLFIGFFILFVRKGGKKRQVTGDLLYKSRYGLREVLGYENILRLTVEICL